MILRVLNMTLGGARYKSIKMVRYLSLRGLVGEGVVSEYVIKRVTKL